MLDTVLPYKIGYYPIDKQEGFVLPEESMRDFKHSLQRCLSDTEDSAQIANTAIRSVFNGNEEAYNIEENIFAFTASAMTPIGTMSGAGTLTLRSGATMVSKLAISDAAGCASEHYIYELTGNRTESRIGVMATSFGTGFALNKIDTRFSISNSRPVPAESVQIETPKTGFAEQMSPEDAARYNQFWDDVENGIDVKDRIKLNSWDRRPSAKLYVENKHTYDNPKYFNQDILTLKPRSESVFCAFSSVFLISPFGIRTP